MAKTADDDRARVIAAAKRIRRAAKGLNFDWLRADAEDPDGGQELTPWVLLAMAALEDEGEDEDE